jgi:hypothetical protein
MIGEVYAAWIKMGIAILADVESIRLRATRQARPFTCGIRLTNALDEVFFNE